MTNNLLKGLLALSGAGLLLSLWLASSNNSTAAADSGGQASAGTTNQSELQRLRAELAALKSRMAQLEALPGTKLSIDSKSQADGEESTDQDSEDQGTSDDDGLTEAERMEQRKQAHIDAYETQLIQESSDPEWSDQTERAIAQTLALDQVDGSNLLSADCQSTLCRVEIEHDDLSRERRFVGSIPHQKPFHTQGFYFRVPEEDGRYRTVMYIARDGHALSSPGG